MNPIAADRSGHLEADHHRIWWEYHGTGDREVVVLLNGVAMSTRAWDHFLGDVRPDFDVLLFDYLGQGASSSPDAPYSIPEFCRYLAQILDHLVIDRTHLMGISYGGFVGLDFARLYPERLHTLTLSGILLSHERLFEMYQDLSLRFYDAGPLGLELYTYYLYEKIFGEAFLREVPESSLESMRQRLIDRYRDRTFCLTRLTEAQADLLDSLDANLPAYRAVATPTLILAGRQDRTIPVWQQRKLCDLLADTRFLIVEETGHVVYLERREAFFALLKAFATAKRTDFSLPDLPSASGQITEGV